MPEIDKIYVQILEHVVRRIRKQPRQPRTGRRRVYLTCVCIAETTQHYYQNPASD